MSEIGKGNRFTTSDGSTRSHSIYSMPDADADFVRMIGEFTDRLDEADEWGDEQADCEGDPSRLPPTGH